MPDLDNLGLGILLLEVYMNILIITFIMTVNGTPAFSQVDLRHMDSYQCSEGVLYYNKVKVEAVDDCRNEIVYIDDNGYAEHVVGGFEIPSFF